MRKEFSALCLMDISVTKRCNLNCDYCSACAEPKGAEILYCISLNMNYGKMVDYFVDKYCIESDIVKKDIQFLDGYSCNVLIQEKLSELNFNTY